MIALKVSRRSLSRFGAVASLILLVVVTACGSGRGVSAPAEPFLVPTFPPGCPNPVAAGTAPPVVAIHVLRASASSALIVAGVCVNGKGPFPFAVDTGAGVTVIDSSLAPDLRLADQSPSTQTNSFGCSRPISFAQATGMSVGAVGLDTQRVIIGTLRSPDVPGLMGLLGSDALSRFGAVRIDYDRHTMMFGGPEQSPQGPASIGGDGTTPSVPAALSAGTTETIPLRINALAIRVPQQPDLVQVVVSAPVQVGGNDEQFLVDTGDASTVLAPSVAATAHLQKARTTARIYAGLDCGVNVTYYRIRQWRVGDVALSPQTVGSTALPPGVAGLLGSGTLQRVSPVVIDYKDGDLLLGTAHGPRPRLLP